MRLFSHIRPRHLCALVVALLVSQTFAPVAQAAKPAREAVELLVRFETTTSESERSQVRSRHGLDLVERLPLDGLDLVRVRNGRAPDMAADVAREHRVRWAEPNARLMPFEIVPNDSYFGSQWALRNTGQTSGTPDADIDASDAWEVTSGSEEIVVAVIDSGVDITHPDLAPNIWTNPGEVPSNGVDDDGNGYVDDVHGWDFAGGNASVFDNPTVDEHGTHVAGTIAAVRGNAAAVAGVSRAKIMPLKFMGAEGGLVSDALKALDYAVDMGAQISNHSYGGPDYSQAMRDKIAEAGRAGHLVVAAAGNESTDNDTTPQYPASYANSNVVSVAATTSTDALASFSNYGDLSVDLGAPGVSIVSTIPGATVKWRSGTSMAAPHVSGALAEVLASYPGIAHLTAKNRVVARGDIAIGLQGKTTSGRRLNLANALDQTGSPQLELVDLAPERFSPEVTEAVITWKANEPTDVSVAVAANATPIRTETLGGTPAAATSWAWDGRADDGGLVPNGDYDITVDARDVRGNTAALTATVTVVEREVVRRLVDFDGDGYDDIVVGIPGEGLGSKDNAGVITVFQGSASGLDRPRMWHQDSAGVPGVAAAGDAFGSAVATGDFDGDGYTDLAIGSPGDDVGGRVDAGVVNILYGSSSGLSAAGAQLWHQDTPGVRGVAEAGDRFGDALAVGDLNADGRADLAIGASGEGIGARNGAGAVNVLYGSSTGLTTSANQVWHQDTPGVRGVAEAGDRFGAALAIGDIDADGRADLAVGAPGEGIGARNGAGAVNVLYGSTSGLTASGNQLWHQDTPGVRGVAEAGDRFGAALAIGDIDADGRADLAVGVPGEGIGARNGAGAVNVLYGSTSGLTASGNQLWHQDTPGVRGVAEAGDRFGAALAIGDIDRDERADLAVGVPGEGIGSRNDAGAVNVLFAAPSGGLTASGNQLWHQDIAGVSLTATAGDRFGAAVVLGDIDADDRAELAIGAPGDGGAGVLHLLRGTPGGITTVDAELWSQADPVVPGGPEAGDRFGAVLG